MSARLEALKSLAKKLLVIFGSLIFILAFLYINLWMGMVAAIIVFVCWVFNKEIKKLLYPYDD